MICRLATLSYDLCRIFSRDRAIRKPWAFLYYYFRFRIRKFFKSKAQFENFLGLRIHFPDYQQFYALWQEIFLEEIYRPPSSLPSPRKIIDAGSNIGLSILFFCLVYPQAVVLGFEVSDSTFTWLRKNIEDNNLKNVKVLNMGLAGRAGTAQFFDCGDGSGSSNIVEGFHSDTVRRTKNVSVKTLSSFLEGDIDIVKIDIEGAEFDVLEEAGKKLRAARFIVAEIHQVAGEKNSRIADALNVLDKNGFRLAIVNTAITHRTYARNPQSRYNIVVSATRV